MPILTSILTNNLTKVLGFVLVAVMGLYLYYCHQEIKSLEGQLANSQQIIINKDQAIRQWQNEYNSMKVIVDENNKKIDELEDGRKDLLQNLEDSETVINKKDMEHQALVQDYANAQIPENSCKESLKWLNSEAIKLGQRWESGQ